MKPFYDVRFCLVLAAVAVQGLSLRAEDRRADELRALVQGRRVAAEAAYAAIKRGDATAGLATLVTGVDRRLGARDFDLQMADQLAAVACRFRNEGDLSRAREVVTLALERINSGHTRVSPKDSARALALAAQLYDHVLGDGVQARALYVRVLTIDPASRSATDRLAHLDAIAARATEKTVANEMLRRRAQEDKR
jgi:hypothetical protein